MSSSSGRGKRPTDAEAQAVAAEPASVQSWTDSDSTALISQPIDTAADLPLRGTRRPSLIASLAAALIVAAILASAMLLLFDAHPLAESLLSSIIALAPKAWAWFGHAPLSAMPLLLAGASYVVLQAVLRPPPLELLRRLMLGSAFLLWGIVQLMPEGAAATTLGDVVITLYVIDLGLMIQAELQRRSSY